MFSGRIFVSGAVRAITGLHVGGSAGALAIGGVDQPVIRNLWNGQPYLPGSSIRGKMRSLAEKFQHRPLNTRIGQDVWIHVCEDESAYRTCSVCRVFGVPGKSGRPEYGGPTRLLVRDVGLSPESVAHLESIETDLPFTEIKWEAAIDRVTAAATPRQQERVPAGAVFAPLDLVYSVYDRSDLEGFHLVLQALQLVEDDYLGGQGSRGSGKVRFENLAIAVRRQADYDTPVQWDGGAAGPTALLERWSELQEWLDRQLQAG